MPTEKSVLCCSSSEGAAMISNDSSRVTDSDIFNNKCRNAYNELRKVSVLQTLRKFRLTFSSRSDDRL